VIARVWNLGQTASSFSLTLSEPLSSARRITHIETDRGDAPVLGGTVTSAILQQQLLSFRLVPASLPPGVKIVPSDARLTEAGDRGSFTVIRTGSTTYSLDVYYTMSGTAIQGVDYAPVSGVATIPPGASSTVIPLIPIADASNEGEETITATIMPQPGYIVGLWKSATASIISPSGSGAVGSAVLLRIEL